MRTNLVIDGNYLLSKDVFILYNMKTLYSDLGQLLRNDLEKLIRLHPFNDVYFVSDSKFRWRKNFYSTYKESRKHDDKIDWDAVYEIYEDFKEEVRNKPNAHLCEVKWAEGDDLVAYIVNEGNKKGISNLIVASDSDLHQLLRFDLGKSYINIAYNYRFTDEKTFYPENYSIFIDHISTTSTSSLFDMNEDVDFLQLIDDFDIKTKTVEVSGEELLFTKMVSGDKKDSIPSAYQSLTKTGKVRGIGKAGGLTIYKLFKETNNDAIDFDSDEFIDAITDIVCFNKKVTDKTIYTTVKENMIRNRKLLILTDKYIPTELYDEFKDTIKIL